MKSTIFFVLLGALVVRAVNLNGDLPTTGKNIVPHEYIVEHTSSGLGKRGVSEVGVQLLPT
jgi:hypothetical protein